MKRRGKYPPKKDYVCLSGHEIDYVWGMTNVETNAEMKAGRQGNEGREGQVHAAVLNTRQAENI